jgi:hypothetical protein
MIYFTVAIKTRSKILKMISKNYYLKDDIWCRLFWKVPVLEGEPYGPPIFELAESSLPQRCFPSRDHVTNLKKL